MKEATKIVSAEGAVTLLEGILAKGLTGCSFAHVKTVTDPKLLKKSRVTKLPLPNADKIVKVSEFGCGIGYSYDKSVENRLLAEHADALKEGTITKEEVLAKHEKGDTWHEPFNGSKVIRQHKKTKEKYFYVQLNANTIPSVKYVDISTGTELSKDFLKDYLPTESAPTNQGLSEENVVQMRTLKLESLKGLSACGETYEIV